MPGCAAWAGDDWDGSEDGRGAGGGGGVTCIGVPGAWTRGIGATVATLTWPLALSGNSTRFVTPPSDNNT
jgi:hypothetical protein